MPRQSKPTSTPQVDESKKQSDALWLFEQFMNCDPPVSLNVTGIAEKTGVKPNTIVKRINTLQHRYPGFGIYTRTSGARESSNFSSPALTKGIKTPVKVGTRTAGKRKIEAVDSEDEDDEIDDENVRKDRLGKDLEKNEQRQTRAVSRAAEFDKISRKADDTTTKPKVSRASVGKSGRSAKDLDVDTDQDESEIERPPRKIASPKTRAGRKSAGIELTEGDIHETLEMKDRTTGSKRRMSRAVKSSVGEKIDQNRVEDEDVAMESVGEGKSKESRRATKTTVKSTHSDESTPSNDSTKPKTGTKRKRDISSELVSSPMSPLTSPNAIEERLMGIEDGQLGDEEPGDESYRDRNPVALPGKKQKTSHDTEEVLVQVEGEEVGDLTPTEEVQDNLEASVVHQADVTDSLTAVPPELETALDTSDEDDQNTDLSPRAVVDQSEEPSKLPELESENSGIDALSGDREHIADPRTGSDEFDQAVVAEAVPFLEEMNNTIPETPYSIPRDALSTSKTDEDMPDDATVGNDQEPNDITIDNSRSVPQESQISRWFNKPLEWMVWNPNARPARSHSAFELGRVLP